MRPDQSRRAATVIAASGVEAGSDRGKTCSLRRSPALRAVDLSAQLGAARTGACHCPETEARRRTRPAYTDAVHAPVGERTVDLTQSEVLVTMCIAYFHPHSTHELTRAPAVLRTRRRIFGRSRSGRSAATIFLALTGPGGATRASGQKPQRRRAPARLRPRP